MSCAGERHKEGRLTEPPCVAAGTKRTVVAFPARHPVVGHPGGVDVAAPVHDHAPAAGTGAGRGIVCVRERAPTGNPARAARRGGRSQAGRAQSTEGDWRGGHRPAARALAAAGQAAAACQGGERGAEPRLGWPAV